MNELVKLLNQIEADTSIEDIKTSKENPLVKKAVSVANRVLAIPPKPSVEIIMKMQKAGYVVYPGERDSFGWVIGCIETKKGTIVFG